MRAERKRNFRHFRKTIHPLSKFKNIWEFLILHTILLNNLIFYHSSSSISAELPLVSYFLGVILEIIIIFDIYVNTRCGYIDTFTKKVVLDLNVILRHYCSTKLFIHVAGAMPMHVLMFLRYGMNITCCDLCKANYFMSTLIILSTFRLLRFIEATQYYARRRKTYALTSFCRLLRIFMVSVTSMIQCVLLADTMTCIYFMTTDHFEPSYYTLVIFVKFGVKLLPNLKLFAYDLMRMSKIMLFRLSGSRLLVRFHLDFFFCVVEYCIAVGFYFWGIVEWLAIVSRGKYAEDQMIKNKEKSTTLAKQRRLPDKITLKLQDYYDYNMSKPAVIEVQNELYKCLPPVLKKEILRFNYSRLLSRIPYFSEWPMKIIGDLVISLKEEIYMQQDVVAEAGIQGEGLFILEVGMIAVYTSDQKEMGHLIDGDFFGELSLVTDREIRTSYLVAITNCKILVLGKNQFRKCMRDHSDLFFKLRNELKRRYIQKMSSFEANQRQPSTIMQKKF